MITILFVSIDPDTVTERYEETLTRGDCMVVTKGSVTVVLDKVGR